MTETNITIHHKYYFPSSVTTLRIVCAPIIYYLIVNQVWLWVICIFFVVCLTDLLDGYLARLLNAKTSFGAYFDATADFIFILVTFSAFIKIGFYPNWLAILIIFMFLIFIITSGRKKPIYDPMGKHYGTCLMGAIGFSLFFPTENVYYTLLWTIMILSFFSIVSRIIFLFNRYEK